MFLLWRLTAFACTITLAQNVELNFKDSPRLLSQEYPETKYFRQKLDHFDPTNDATYLQRYLISTQDFTNNGPIFFYAGNEGDITMFVNNTGFMWDIAPTFGAMVVFAEHRYYGGSKPYPGVDPSPESVHKFAQFTVEQALADYAELIQFLKISVPNAATSPVVAFGGSYGGMLAAWLRRKYPHIVDGAIAASAPVAYFPGLVDCHAYNDVVTTDFASVVGGAACVDNIRRTWGTLGKISKQHDGYSVLTETFRLCDKLKSTEALNDWLESAWGSLAMVNYPYAANFLNPLPAWPVQETCNHLSQPSLQGLELLKGVHNAVGVFYNYTGDKKCFSIHAEPSAGLSTGLWDYQTCTEMVMPFCSDGVKDMFRPTNWTIESFTKDCQKKYGVTPRPEWASLQFGGRSWKYQKNIIFSNGKLDPWQVGGVTEPSGTVNTLLIEHAAHHLDLRAENPKDPQSVKIARRVEIESIATWIVQAMKDGK